MSFDIVTKFENRIAEFFGWSLTDIKKLTMSELRNLEHYFKKRKREEEKQSRKLKRGR